MLLPLTNEPRDYAWGSRTLIAALEGREPAAVPEAEVWFGDHPSDPADLADGRTLRDWIAEEGAAHGVAAPLPYLLKLLAAASPLSIQVHPSKAQAEEGFAREAGLPGDAPRNYADDNHKPEMIVALSDRFEALCGLRAVADSRRLLAALGPAADPLLERLTGDADLTAVLGWLLSGRADEAVAAIIAALDGAESTEFAPALANARRIAAVYPGDPGVVVALLMNYTVLRRGEAMFLRAGLLHAYVSGLGVELMAASDNVLRGGLTPKHIDVDELLRIVDATPGPVPVVLPVSAEGGNRGVESFPAPVPDFRLLRARVSEGGVARFLPTGPAIVLATSGEITVESGGDAVALTPGRAAFATADAGEIRVRGAGEAFLAQPGS
ncbi:mannose-6-phosphate isomerase, class I [Microbacterium sediminis]|uniref:mannose-6-phosphate isomerase n=1 Tax=Microbacterium sediminis TaxID=904291 RepID=A0A1B9NBB6_9MICO|nr:mannose-6-phosphate isomerase, class I [Microbacterium sediminis]OCG73895.1 mannose-6-phosphate isomerase, class I [Microbacterium sediminis]QBR74646.1 mannose-6-phosphate isomerase, class I [Microbacterium sediminis]